MPVGTLGDVGEDGMTEIDERPGIELLEAVRDDGDADAVTAADEGSDTRGVKMLEDCATLEYCATLKDCATLDELGDDALAVEEDMTLADEIENDATDTLTAAAPVAWTEAVSEALIATGGEGVDIRDRLDEDGDGMIVGSPGTCFF